ncbi:hypothetical protein QBC45DRAFT_407071 [Copromyces sp. CBS 386.78]|nr:hypothetical protein QBC45DRAFT_407071 [Copromyces sp. CBS 386.78]
MVKFGAHADDATSDGRHGVLAHKTVSYSISTGRRKQFWLKQAREGTLSVIDRSLHIHVPDRCEEIEKSIARNRCRPWAFFIDIDP